MQEVFYEDILETFLFCFLVSLGIIQIAAARRGWHGLSLYGGRVRANLNHALGAALIIFGYAWYFSDPLHRNVRNIEALMSLVCLALGVVAAAAATALIASLAEALRRLARRGRREGKGLSTEVFEFPEGKAVLTGSWGDNGKNLVVMVEPGMEGEKLLRALRASLPARGGILSLHPRSGLGEGTAEKWAGEEEMMAMLSRLETERGLEVRGESFLALGWCANAALRLRRRLEEAREPRALLAVAPVAPYGESDLGGDALLSNTPLDILSFLYRNRPWDPRAVRRALTAWAPVFLASAALATAVTVAFDVRWKFISGPVAGFLLSLWVTYFLLARGRGGRTSSEALLAYRARVPECDEGPPPTRVILTQEEVAGALGSRLFGGVRELEPWREVLRGKFLLNAGTASRLAALIWGEAEGDAGGPSPQGLPAPWRGGKGSPEAEG